MSDDQHAEFHPDNCHFEVESMMEAQESDKIEGEFDLSTEQAELAIFYFISDQSLAALLVVLIPMPHSEQY